MANEIYKTGRMFVVWPTNPDVRSQQDGIEKMIESIERTGAECTWCPEIAAEDVGNRAMRYFNQRECNPLAAYRPDSEEYQRAMQEFGQRAVYEVRVRYVGKVDAEGRFTEIEGKKRKK